MHAGFYPSLFTWVTESLSHSESRPLFIGVSAPQGAGKTTLTRWLCATAQSKGLKAVSLSIDDFYLTRGEQVKLAEAHPDNPYLQQRGYPGTHDVAFGVRVLDQLKAGRDMKLPRYDKSAYQGKGDRAPEATWLQIKGRQDVVFLEGWMLGFEALPEAQCPDENFSEVNRLLPAYQQWDVRMDRFCWLEPRRIEYVVDWRIEAEERMKAEGKAGMIPAEIRAYIEKFLPAYRTYLPGMRRWLTSGAFHIMIEYNREKISETVES